MNIENLKVALICDYLNEYGGAERVLETMLSVFPKATVFTSIYDQSIFPDQAKAEYYKVVESKITNLPFFGSLSKQYTFVYPTFFENFDLRGFDLIISSGTIWSKSVLTKPEQLHIYYCHTPARFLYRYPSETSKRNVWYYKPFVAYIDNYLRVWDFCSAQRPDYFIANSNTVKERIKKYYKRDADILYPPIKTTNELMLPEGISKFDTNYYLFVGRLAAYKNIDALISAFNLTDYPLRIVGTGKEESYLKSLVKGNIAFLGKLSDRELAMQYQNCKGFITAVADEDLGMVPIEAMSHGKPVLAYKSGGHRETIEDGKTGMFFDSLDTNKIIMAVTEFDKAINANVFEPGYIKETAKRYDEDLFKKKLLEIVEAKWNDKFGSK